MRKFYFCDFSFGSGSVNAFSETTLVSVELSSLEFIEPQGSLLASDELINIENVLVTSASLLCFMPYRK